MNGDGYGIHEDGNTLSYDAIDEYYKEKFPNLNFSYREHIEPRVQDLIIDTIMSVRADLNASKRNNFFELFGFDFLIDEDYRTWLIECNTNPYLGVPNKFIKDLLPKMVDDMLELILDEKYPRANPKTDDRLNDFKLLYRCT